MSIKQRSGQRARIPLRVVLIVPFMLLLVTTAGLVGYISYWNGQRTVDNLANQLGREIASRIADQVNAFLEIPHQIDQTNAALLRQGLLNTRDAVVLTRHFWEQVQIYDAVTSIYFGTPQGGIAGSGREGAEGALYVYSTPGLASGDFKKSAVDAQGLPVELLATVPNFDARQRPWYTSALEKGEVGWSSVYALSTGQDMAIAASQPVYDSAGRLLGVVSVDVFLSHLSDFLRNLKVGASGHSFIIEHSGLLIASSWDRKPFLEPTGGKAPERLHVSQSSSPMIRQAAAFLENHYGAYANIEQEQQQEFEIEGVHHYVLVTPVHRPGGIDWLVVVVAPETDFMAQMIDNNRATVLSTVFALLCALFVGYFAVNWIAAPMARLTASTRILAAGQWQTAVESHWVLEIDTLTRSFNHMASQLKDTLESLNQEVAERKQAELTLQESEARFRTLAQQMPVMIDAQDDRGTFIFWNRQCEEVTGYAAGEIIGNPAGVELLYPDSEYRQSLMEEWAQRGDTFIDWQIELTRKDGAKRIVSWTNLAALYPIPGWITWAIGVDVTEQRQAQAAREQLLTQVSEQAQQTREIMNIVPEGVMLLDVDGRVILANPVAVGILNVLAGIQVGGVLTRLGDRSLRELLEPAPGGLWHEIRSDGQTYELVARRMRRDQQSDWWVVVVRDVTREREAQQQVQQQARLAAVGQLSAGIAHDFNNILAVILLYTEITLTTADLSSEVRNRLGLIAQQTRRAADLIQQVLDFSRRSVIECHPINLALLVKEQIRFLQRTLPENIRLHFEHSDEAYASVDPTRIQQAVLNLAVNARDAMPDGGQFTISLRRVPSGEPLHCITCGLVMEGEWASISFSDNGTGIPANVMPHIFEPFFTTKAPGKGVGLGLAQVFGIVKQHGGHIAVRSSGGEGTKVELYLPLLPGGEEHAPVVGPGLAAPGQKQTILVVEDEANVQKALEEILGFLNYRAVCAANGRQALEILKSQSSAISLVLSDVVMPEMGGIELFRSLKRSWPDIPMVLMTGHPMQDELEQLQAEGLKAWLLKPPTLQHLNQLLSQLVGRQA